jgi:aryl-alcohol dehydrogenase-like predicted oxidoreductase
MEHRRIGSLEVSVVGLGCNNFGMRIDADQARAVVDAALDAGITFFDTADVYGGTKSEEMLGAALGSRRGDVVVATKFGNQIGEDPTHRGAGAAWVKRATEASLRRLGTDRLDLQQLHRPDADTPVEETLRALDELVRAGKIREVGCSNFSAQMIGEAEAAAAAAGASRFVSVQNQLSLLHRDALSDVLPLCEQLHIGFVPYFPLASGLLTGKYVRGEAPPGDARLSMVPQQRRDALLNARNFDLVDRLTRYAADHGKTLLDLAMSWLVAHPGVASVIAGATKPEQVRANVEAAQWRLTPQQVEEVAALAAADAA